MTRKNRYWKGVYVVTVLSEGEHPPKYGNMHELANDICTGDAIGDFTHTDEEITKDEMKGLLEAQHADPEFLIPKCTDCDGKGWRHATRLEDQRAGIERCDSCAVYDGDATASEVHATVCGCGLIDLPSLNSAHAHRP